jgi:hypothetical protein
MQRLGDMDAAVPALVALARANGGHPLDNTQVKRWYDEQPGLIAAALRDASPDEAALMLARLYVAGLGTRELHALTEEGEGC